MLGVVLGGRIGWVLFYEHETLAAGARPVVRDVKTEHGQTANERVGKQVMSRLNCRVPSRLYSVRRG